MNQPDPAAVRAALEEIDELKDAGVHIHSLWEVRVKHAILFEAATRAWLAEHGETSESPAAR